MDNMQIGLKVVIELIRVLRDFVSIISDFLPKRSGGSSLNKTSFDKNA